MIVTTKRISDGIAIILPKSIVQGMGLTDGDSLDITIGAGGLVMKKKGRPPRRSLAQIVAQIKSESYRQRSCKFSGNATVSADRATT